MIHTNANRTGARRSRRRTPALACLSVLACTSILGPVAMGQDAVSRVQSVFGERLRLTAQTIDPTDDVDLGRDMLTAALAARQNDPAMAIVLAERAYELTNRFSLGHQTAFDAQMLLVDIDTVKSQQHLSFAGEMAQTLFNRARPTERIERGNQLLDILIELGNHRAELGDYEAAALVFSGAIETAGQIASGRIEQLRARRHELETRARAKKLAEQVRRNPTDAASAAALMRVMVVELDDPVGALEFRFLSDDVEFRQNTLTATLADERVLTGDLLILGDWYAGLVDEASRWAAPAMTARARTYYRMYLERGGGDEPTRQRVATALGALGGEADLAAIQAAAPEPRTARVPRTTTARAATPAPNTPASPQPPALTSDDQIDLLALVKPARHGRRGEWTGGGSGLRGQRPTPAQLVIPVAPSGDYELRLAFTRESVIGSVVVHLPVGGRAVLLRMGDRRRQERDYVAGLSMIGGKSAEENETTTAIEIESERRYRLRVLVRGKDPNNVSIAAELDGETIVYWSGSASVLRVADAWGRLEADALGLGVDAGGTVLFEEVTLKVIDGSVSTVN